MINTNYLNLTDFQLLALKLNDKNSIKSDFDEKTQTFKFPNDSYQNNTNKYQSTLMNINTSVGYMQKAYNTLNDILPYTKELSHLTKKLSNIHNTYEKEVLQNKIDSLTNEINKYTKSTFNGEQIFNNKINIGDYSIKLQLSSLNKNDKDSIQKFDKSVELLRKDIKNYLDTTNIIKNDFLNTTNKIDYKQEFINKDSITKAHNYEHLFTNIEEILL